MSELEKVQERIRLEEEYINELITTDPRRWEIHEIYPNVGNMQKLIKSLHEKIQAHKQVLQICQDIILEYRQKEKESNKRRVV